MMPHNDTRTAPVLTYGRYRTDVANCRGIQPQRYTFDVREVEDVRGAEFFQCQSGHCFASAAWVLTYGAAGDEILAELLVCNDCFPSVAATKRRTVKRKSCAC